MEYVLFSIAPKITHPPEPNIDSFVYIRSGNTEQQHIYFRIYTGRKEEDLCPRANTHVTVKTTPSQPQLP